MACIPISAGLNYSFRGKYLVEMLGRRDGSSRFAPGHKWSNFYNAFCRLGSYQWKLHPWPEPVSPQLPEDIRGGYGIMGNNVNIDMYDYISDVVIGNSLFGSTPGIQRAASLARNGLYFRPYLGESKNGQLSVSGHRYVEQPSYRPFRCI